MSEASNLVVNDTNTAGDVFVFDRLTRQISRVSVASDGGQADPASYMSGVSISADGRYVVFCSTASSLAPGDTNNGQDAFVHDRETRQTHRISINGCNGGTTISADGQFVAFEGVGPTGPGIVVYDRRSGESSLASVGYDGSPANGQSMLPALSADGQWVVFNSFASNLVPGDTNRVGDVFVWNRRTGQTSRVSVHTGGAQGNSVSSWLGQPAISGDGRYVAFYSYASNLVDGDTNNNCTTTTPPMPGGTANCPDVFVHDRQTGETALVSRASDGTQGNYSSSGVSISPDGRYIAFSSVASNLVPGDTNDVDDVFLVDQETGQMSRVSVSSSGVEATESSMQESLAVNGRYVVFMSSAGNLVSGDTQGYSDVFVNDLGAGAFLDLPVDYERFAVSAQGNAHGNGPGRVNSWFDHDQPDYGLDYEVTNWSSHYPWGIIHRP